MACNIEFIDGNEIATEDMEENTIYLDGAVREPVIDAENRSYSFDHHGDSAPRLSLKAACQQVCEALELGLEAQLENGDFDVVLNDIDADSILSVWLCQNPGAWRDDRVQELVESVGFVDSHGPTRSPHDLHNALGIHPQADKNIEDVEERLEILDKWFETGEIPDAFSPPGGTAVGLDANGKRFECDTDAGFDTFYEQGGVAGVLFTEEDDEGRRTFTLGKKSDFVPGDLSAVLDALNEAEPSDDGEWGGSSTVGGSPRPNGSSLDPEEVFETLKAEFGPKLS